MELAVEAANAFGLRQGTLRKQLRLLRHRVEVVCARNVKLMFTMQVRVRAAAQTNVCSSSSSSAAGMLGQTSPLVTWARMLRQSDSDIKCDHAHLELSRWALAEQHTMNDMLVALFAFVVLIRPTSPSARVASASVGGRRAKGNPTSSLPWSVCKSEFQQGAHGCVEESSGHSDGGLRQCCRHEQEQSSHESATPLVGMIAVQGGVCASREVESQAAAANAGAIGTREGMPKSLPDALLRQATSAGSLPPLNINVISPDGSERSDASVEGAPVVQQERAAPFSLILLGMLPWDAVGRPWRSAAYQCAIRAVVLGSVAVFFLEMFGLMPLRAEVRPQECATRGVTCWANSGFLSELPLPIGAILAMMPVSLHRRLPASGRGGVSSLGGASGLEARLSMADGIQEVVILRPVQVARKQTSGLIGKSLGSRAHSPERGPSSMGRTHRTSSVGALHPP